MRLRLLPKRVTNRPVPLGVIYLLSLALLALLNARKWAFDHWGNGNGSGQHYLIKQKTFYLRRLSGVVTDGPFLLLEERSCLWIIRRETAKPWPVTLAKSGSEIDTINTMSAMDCHSQRSCVRAISTPQQIHYSHWYPYPGVTGFPSHHDRVLVFYFLMIFNLHVDVFVTSWGPISNHNNKCIQNPIRFHRDKSGQNKQGGYIDQTGTQ